jgi:hypothetical protein
MSVLKGGDTVKIKAGQWVQIPKTRRWTILLREAARQNKKKARGKQA